MANEKRLIDANALIAEIAKAQDSLSSNNDAVWRMNQKYYKGLAWAHRLVIDAPTVDAVEVKHGRWLFDSNTERYFCSACNEQALYTSRDVPEYDYDWEENLRYSHTETIIEEHLTNYCPNCGADMR